ncbi:MAG: hypothetical protein CMA84_06035 [Euryarchaeota archaeon]|nr:hypothetical protein [Euryarchaeota archaeon]
MPLVDAPTIQLDESLMQGIANTFSTSRGLIFDKSDHPWCIWHVGQLQHWWRLYGEKVDSPMGRKLANAAVEQESWQLNQTNFASIKGIFRSKKQQKWLEERWNTFGWGKPDIKDSSLENKLLSSLSAGWLHAVFESMNQTRLRLRWEDRGSHACKLMFDETNYPYQEPVAPPAFAWNSIPKANSSPLNIEVEKGLIVDGERLCLLPAGLFDRLLDSSAGIEIDIDQEVWQIDIASFEHSAGLVALAEASKAQFLDTEQHILIMNPEDWMEVCQQILASRGYSMPTKVKGIDAHGGVKVTFESCPFLFICMGVLAGAWQRAEGRPVKTTCEGVNGQFVITLESFHELA